jgi:toxin-antitoxin system PIN domain toxin
MGVNGVALLDVNVLVALFDPDHAHHEPAHRWFADQRLIGWATCPLTENGLLRVLSHPAYPRAAERPEPVLDRLRTFCGSGGHQFWPDEVSLRDAGLFAAGAPLGHRQVTDLYLLGLAVRRKGCLGTFDRAIPLARVRAAKAENLALIPA